MRSQQQLKLKKNADSEQDMILQELREAFNLFDTQHTGEIDAKELKVWAIIGNKGVTKLYRIISFLFLSLL